MKKMLSSNNFEKSNNNRMQSVGLNIQIFNLNLNENKTKINDLEAVLLNNGVDKVKEHCTNLRSDIQETTKQTIELVNRLNKELIKNVDDYEAECLRIIGKRWQKPYVITIKSSESGLIPLFPLNFD